MASEIFLNIFRSHVNDANLCIFDFGDFRLDAARRLLLKGDDRQPVKLTSKAFDTLLYMVLHAGTIVSKDELMRAVWPDTVVEENNLSQNVFAIRRALGEKQGENRYIFAVQDAISGRVAGALALHLGGEEERRLTKHYTDNAAAYELYLTGRYHLFKLTPTEVRKAAGFFQEAVAADPAYALAYTGIADAYRTLPITSDVPPKDAFPKATEAVTKALQLDDSLAEAHAIRGWIKFWFDWDWAASESNFRRAIDLDPNNADAHRGYAHLLSNTGRHEEALREVEKARELDPLSLITNTLQGQFLRFAGHDDEAERSFEKALELDSNFWVAHINLANVLIEKKMYAQALTHLAKAREQSGGNTQTLSITAYALALAGERERARGLLEDLRRMSGERYVPPYNLGMVHHGLGEREEALDWLEKAFDGRDVLLTFVAVDPKWDAFRSDQRFVSLLQRMKLRN